MSISESASSKVRSCIQSLRRITFCSYNGNISDKPIDVSIDSDGSRRKYSYDQISIREPNSEIIEVGIVEKIREEYLQLACMTKVSESDIEKNLLEAENNLIRERLRSAVVLDSTKVDLLTPFEPDTDQISVAKKELNLKFAWMFGVGEEMLSQYVDTYLRSKYLPEIDIFNNQVLRQNTLNKLNGTLRFLRIETPCATYVDLYVSVLGVKTFEVDVRKSTSTIDYGVIYFEQMDAKLERTIKSPFITSSSVLKDHAEKMPDRSHLTYAQYVMGGILLFIDSLLSSNPRLTGRIGIKKSENTAVEWVWDRNQSPSLSTLPRKLPAGFYLAKGLMIKDFRAEEDSANRSKIEVLFPSFYYLTHLDNLSGMLRDGIQSWTEIGKRNVEHVSIADPAAQRWRECKESVYKRKIHDYVPLYLNPKNPMLSARRHMSNDLVILRVSRNVLNSNKFVFADGNAASGETLYSIDPLVLNSSIEALTADYWTDIPEGKRRRCAEVLIYPFIDPKFIECIICSNEDTAKLLRQIAKVEVTVDRDKYF